MNSRPILSQFNKKFVINENINKILLKSAGVHHAERGIADQAADHHHPAGNREAPRLNEMTELVVFGLTTKEAIEAKFGPHGEVTGVVTVPGRKAK